MRPTPALPGRAASALPLASGARTALATVVGYVGWLNQTPLGSLVLNKLWPAYFFCLVVLARGIGLRETLGSWPALVAERGVWAVTAWLLHQSLSLVFLSLVVILFIIRKPVVGQRSRWLGAAVALGGTFVMAFIGAPAATTAAWPVLALASLLIAAGTIFSAASLVALGSCFGIFPEARGLVTRGPYRWLRHPVYVGELASGLGLILPVLTVQSVAVYGLFVGLQYWRAVNEERALAAVFPEYAAYRRRTWRLVPRLH